jgi:hypothetical protein
MSSQTKTRPIGVAAIGVFFLGASVFALVTGSSLLLPNSILAVVWRLNESSLAQFESMGVMYSAALLLSVALATSVAGVALLKGRKVGWWLAVTLFLIMGAGDKLELLFSGVICDWIGLSATVALLFYLTRTGVRQYFQEPIHNRFVLKILDNR